MEIILYGWVCHSVPRSANDIAAEVHSESPIYQLALYLRDHGSFAAASLGISGGYIDQPNWPGLWSAYMWGCTSSFGIDR